MKNFKLNLRSARYAVCEKAQNASAAVMEYLDEHGAGVMYTVLIGGLVVILAQDMKYMRMLNSAAKKGDFLWFPGKGSMM